MAQYFDPIGMSQKDRNLLVSRIQKLLKDETDPKLLDNMLLKPWSLVAAVLNPTESTRVHYTETDGVMTSVSASRLESLLVGRLLTCRAGTRMWIDPRFRNQYYPTVHHIPSGTKHAVELGADLVWTSFNEDREALARRIQILQTSEEPSIRDAWTGWVVAPEKVLINSVLQTLAYLKLR